MSSFKEFLICSSTIKLGNINLVQAAFIIILNGIMYGKKDYKETDKTGMKDFLDLVLITKKFLTKK